MTAVAERLGRYTLVRQLGAGGMGELYLARADGIAGFAKLVAVKRIIAHKANDRLVKMLINEARLVASLQHPNIAQVYDIGVENGEYFFAMEYVHGHDLRQVLRRAPGRRLALENSLHVAIGLCAGLHHAHEAHDASGASLGIVHRDVSPGNVLISYDGGVKLVDFGVAKAATLVSETRDGVVKGKYGYMSPEQCLGNPLDRRSDLFAVGILLWELLVGRRLFKVQGELATLQRVVYVDAPRPSRYAADVPADLEQIIMRALARDPERRYATAEQLQLDLEKFAVEHRLSISPVAMSREMNQLFKDRIDAWREAERHGRSLADHLAEVASEDSIDSEELDGVIGELHTNVFTPDSAIAPSTPSAAPEAHRVPAATPQPTAAPRKTRFGALLALSIVAALGGGAFAIVRGLPGDAPAPAARAGETAPVVMHTEAPRPVEPTPVRTPDETMRPDISVPAVDIDAGADETATADAGVTSTTVAEPSRMQTGDRRHTTRATSHGKPKPGRSEKAKSKASTRRDADGSDSAEPATEVASNTAATSKPPTRTAAVEVPVTAAPKPPAGPAPGTVDASAVRAVVRAHLAEIQTCVSRARMDDRDLHGRVTMRIELAANGAVTGTSVASSSGATPSLESCMRKAVATWTFPAPAGGVTAAIRYPFAF
jgi:TonB family protein